MLSGGARCPRLLRPPALELPAPPPPPRPPRGPRSSRPPGDQRGCDGPALPAGSRGLGRGETDESSSAAAETCGGCLLTFAASPSERAGGEGEEGLAWGRPSSLSVRNERPASPAGFFTIQV
ncbi:pecanex-like protein 3 [Macaca nemestrina]|uniref:pecanex-like protein 3 n=1 Tax=Macaca nemestrina TaxID=9545 RepID=UPI0039B984A2